MNTEKDVKDFYERIKEICKNKNITQIDLCNACNINLQSHKNRIVRNVAPDAFDAQKIAKFLDTSVEFLLTGKDENPLSEKVDNLTQKIDGIRKIIDS